MNHLATAALVDRCRAADPLAVETFVRSHQQVVYRLALSVLDDPVEAEDATQDVFLAALRALDSYRGDAAISTWLYTITLNVCRSRLRKRRAWERLTQILHARSRLSGGDGGHVDEATARTEENASLWRAVQALDEKHRLPVILRYYHDFSVAEIARLLDLNEGTVHSRLSIARDRLRVGLSER